MCVRRWRPGDICVSFHHYLQGSSGESGVPGRNGLKGEKVGKLQTKFSPQKQTWSYDVLSQFEHARQLVKTHSRLLALRAILNPVLTLCSLSNLTWYLTMGSVIWHDQLQKLHYHHICRDIPIIWAALASSSLYNGPQPPHGFSLSSTWRSLELLSCPGSGFPLNHSPT